MRNELIAFVSGALIGSAITYIITKSYYKTIADEEIESVKQQYAKRDWEKIKRDTKKSAEGNSKKTYRADKGDLDEYVKNIRNNNYIPPNAPLRSKPSEDNRKEVEIEVISPEKFGENEEYDTIQLTYYNNDILTDDLDEVIENRDQVVGEEFINYFGVYEENAVYVVNRPHKAYYEILLDEDDYIVEDHPTRIEVS